jgi:hypothetical protein
MNRSEKIQIQKELINVLESQVVDLSMMSKIELGDDVIAEIKRLKDLLNEPKSTTNMDIIALLVALGFIGLISTMVIVFGI